jgi:signal transduction histidine kinase
MPDLGDPHRRRFDHATAAQLFKRVYRSDTSRTASSTSSTGSAIGLTIAKAINQAHHGQLLGCSDGLGTGARFEITLPIAGRPRYTSWLIIPIADGLRVQG